MSLKYYINGSLTDVTDMLLKATDKPTLIEKSITANGVYNAADDDADGYSKVTVNVPNSYTSGDDVNFYDYDGTIVHSYTKAEFLALTAIPDNPTHDGLTSQGWNWSLSDAKAHVTTYDKLDIGQMYTTSDGKTHIYVHMEDGRLNPELNLTFVESGSFTVDWGDETTPDTVSGSSNTLGTITHTYAAKGDYVIAITVNEGTVSIVGTSNYSQLFKKANKTNAENIVYRNCIRKIRLGNGVVSIDDYAFNGCKSLTSITIPSGITTISTGAFANCGSLTSITIPSGATRIWSYSFSECESLLSVAIPSGVTTIANFAFMGCKSLTSITIPSGVTSIGSMTFNDCNSLTSVTIPSGVTTIFNGTFINCYSLASITIPSGVTSIGNSTFFNCYGLGYLKFKSNTPPTADAADVFQNIPTDCIIYVPTGKLGTYTAAQNYPDSNTYTYQEYTEV